MATCEGETLISFQFVPDQEQSAIVLALAPCFPNGVVQLNSQRAIRALGPAFSAVPRGLVVFGSLIGGGMLQARLRTMLWGWLRRWGGGPSSSARTPRALAHDNYLTPIRSQVCRGGGRCVIPIQSFCTRAAHGALHECACHDGQLIWLAGEWGRQSDHGRTFRLFGPSHQWSDQFPRSVMVVEEQKIAAWVDPRTTSDELPELTRELKLSDYRSHHVMGVPPAHAVVSAGTVS